MARVSVSVLAVALCDSAMAVYLFSGISRYVKKPHIEKSFGKRMASSSQKGSGTPGTTGCSFAIDVFGFMLCGPNGR